ncbi:hypothetical protein QQ045_031973 [Rhodiola kirilowii]
MAAFPSLEIHHLPRLCFDHRPLLISMSPITPRRSQFKFLGAWLEHTGFHNLVSNTWAGQAHQEPLCNFGLKLKKMHSILKTWNSEIFGDINNQVKAKTLLVDRLESQLQHCWDDDLYDSMKEAKSELSDLLLFQFSVLEEQFKLQWAYDDDTQVIGQAAVSHLQALFGASSTHATIEGEDLVHLILSDPENEALCKPLDKEEIKQVVFSMNPKASPGPDRFTGTQIPNILVATNIILLPKVKGRCSIGQFRPIGLCNFVHKILSNLLNNRLKAYLGQIISPEQT